MPIKIGQYNQYIGLFLIKIATPARRHSPTEYKGISITRYLLTVFDVTN
jgi:hypothetical protein